MPGHPKKGGGGEVGGGGGLGGGGGREGGGGCEGRGGEAGGGGGGGGREGCGREGDRLQRGINVYEEMEGREKDSRQSHRGFAFQSSDPCS